MFRNILVAYDGSPHSERALATAIEVAKCTQAQMTLLNAYDKVPDFLGEPNFQDVVNKTVIAARDMLRDVAAKVSQEGLIVKTNVIEGPAPDAILRVAETEGFDLIIMGSRGLGQFQGLLLGSVSDRVLHHAKIPVLIVR